MYSKTIQNSRVLYSIMLVILLWRVWRQQTMRHVNVLQAGSGGAPSRCNNPKGMEMQQPSRSRGAPMRSNNPTGRSAAMATPTNTPMLTTSSGGIQCPYCGKILPYFSEYQRHLRKHTGERPFACPLCPYATTRKAHLKTHLMKIHKTLQHEPDIGTHSSS